MIPVHIIYTSLFPLGMCQCSSLNALITLGCITSSPPPHTHMYHFTTHTPVSLHHPPTRTHVSLHHPHTHKYHFTTHTYEPPHTCISSSHPPTHTHTHAHTHTHTHTCTHTHTHPGILLLAFVNTITLEHFPTDFKAYQM